MPRYLLNATIIGVLFLIALPSSRCFAADAATADEEVAYKRVINDRVGKIVAKLGVDDAAKRARVHKLIENYYFGLREIHDARDAKVNDAAQTPARDATIANAWNKVAQDQAALKLVDLHRGFLARLTVELTPAQVEQVKDGLTYGVVRITYDRYLELLPDLNEEQKREILATLIEARENAMDGGSSDEKHAIFGKYKGRINNYLSSQGFDLKAAEETLVGQRKVVTPKQ